MDVRSTLVADGQATVLRQPRECPLHHPAMPPQPVIALDPLACDAALDAPSPQELPAAGDVVALVGMQLLRSLTPPSTRRLDGRDGTDEPLKEHRVMPVGATQEADERDAPSVDNKMALRARFALIRWVRAGFSAPLFAGTLAESSEARVQSISSAAPRRSNKVWCNRSQTPASCQSRSRLQQVTPLPQPISWGSSSQGIPVFNTKMIPVNAARLSTGGRPPFGLGRLGGKSGSMTSHSSSLTNGLLITGQHTHSPLRF